MSDEEPEEATPVPARPKKKKRRRPAADTSIDPATDAEEPAQRTRRLNTRDAGGVLPWFFASLSSERAPERPEDKTPAFALDFPADPALQALVAAFERGDYARVRREAPALVRSTDSAAVRKAARTLLQRIEPDPIAVYLLAGAALLLSFLAFWYWTHPHVAP